MDRISVSAPGKRGILFAEHGGDIRAERFFGLPCVVGSGMPECDGGFYLTTDKGRFEGRRFTLKESRFDETSLRLTYTTAGGEYRIDTEYRLDAASGIVTRDDSLTNTCGEPSVVRACLPRITLDGDAYEIYGQASNWSAENQGSWRPLSAGSITFANSSGRSCDSCTPFAFLRHRQTGFAAAIQVKPVGDWIIRAKRVADSRLTRIVVEAGLSDQDLHMTLEAGETVELPQLIMYGFKGGEENGSEIFQRYILGRYEDRSIPELIYNTWFYRFDILEPELLKRQAEAAKELGCRIFVVDAGWFGAGSDWGNQVGNWEECKTRAFAGKMKDFGDYLREIGMGFGLWMEPERACRGTPVYDNHPDWFLDEDTIVYDLCNPEVREYLCGELTRLVNEYDLCWMKLDFNSNMLRDRTGSNYYRYFRAEEEMMRMIRERNPGCTFEGCSSGGMRSDFHNCMNIYHGFFISDTVNPLECLRIRQGAALRMLPPYLGAWTVIHETNFNTVSYFDRDSENRRKILAAADPWWKQTVDVTADFAVKTSLMGEWGLSGDLTSYSEETKASVRKAAEFYEKHRRFLSRCVCRLLTGIQPLNDFTGWTAVQYDNIDGEGSMIFVFRLIDDAEGFILFPEGVDPSKGYRIVFDEEDKGVLSGSEITSDGVKVVCGSRYEGKIISLIPD